MKKVNDNLIQNPDLKRETRTEGKRKRVCSMKGVLAKWYKTGNCAVEAVDLGRREKNETLG